MNTVYKKYYKLAALVWASCFILFLLIYMAVISPQRESQEQISQQLTEKKKRYEAILEINQQDTRAMMNKQMEQWRDKLKDFVAAPEDLAGLTFDIGKIANDIKVDSFSVKPRSSGESRDVSGGKYICENKMNVSFKANFNQFAAFLNAMERHRPVIFVDEFKITYTDHDDSVSQVSMDLSVFVKNRQGS